jgi:hypothetical protein
VTPAGAGSSQYCAKAEDAGRTWIEVDHGTAPTAAKTAGTQHRRIGSPKRNFVAPHADIPHRQTNTPHATSYGLDWPFTRKPSKRSRRLPAVGEVTTCKVIASPTCGRQAGSMRYEADFKPPVPRWLRLVMISDRAGSSWYVGTGFFFAPVLAMVSPWPTVTTVLWVLIALAGLWLGLLGIAMAAGLAMALRAGTEIPEDYWWSIIGDKRRARAGRIVAQ